MEFSLGWAGIYIYIYIYIYIFFFFFSHTGSYFPNQESNPYPLYWKCGVLTIGSSVKSLEYILVGIPPYLNHNDIII